MKEEAEKKKIELSSKILYEVDFDFEPKDRETAITKMTEAAKKVPLSLSCRFSCIIVT